MKISGQKQGLLHGTKDIARVWRRRLIRIFIYLFILGVSFVYIYPYLFIIITSLKDKADLGDVTVMWFPKKLHWQNYQVAWEVLKYFQSFLNSTIVTVGATLGHLLSCSFIAYGFARYKFPLRKFFFTFVILSFMVPIQSYILPLYIQYGSLKMLNTYYPFILPAFLGFGLRGGLFIFLFHQFFLGFPPSLEEASRIDGCTFIGTYFRIFFPNIKTPLLTCGILSMVWHWNDYFEPTLYLDKVEQFLLPQKLPALYDLIEKAQKGTLSSDASSKLALLFNDAVVMAATLLCLLPVLIVYLFLQKKFMTGIERTGLVE